MFLRTTSYTDIFFFLSFTFLFQVTDFLSENFLGRSTFGEEATFYSR